MTFNTEYLNIYLYRESNYLFILLLRRTLAKENTNFCLFNSFLLLPASLAVGRREEGGWPGPGGGSLGGDMLPSSGSGHSGPGDGGCPAALEAPERPARSPSATSRRSPRGPGDAPRGERGHAFPPPRRSIPSGRRWGTVSRPPTASRAPLPRSPYRWAELLPAPLTLPPRSLTATLFTEGKGEHAFPAFILFFPFLFPPLPLFGKGGFFKIFKNSEDF